MTTKVDLGGLHLAEAEKPIPIGGQRWHEWLEEAKSFRFETTMDVHLVGEIFDVRPATFTAVKVSGYWQAHKKVSGKLRREHLGTADKLTYDHMRQVACKISSERYWENRSSDTRAKRESHKTEHETIRETSSQTQDEIAKLKAELERITQDRDNLLIKLGNGKIQASEDAQQRIKQLEARVTELDNANWEPKNIDASTLFNQLRPLLNRLSDRERRAVLSKLDQILS